MRSRLLPAVLLIVALVAALGVLGGVLGGGAAWFAARSSSTSATAPGESNPRATSGADGDAGDPASRRRVSPPDAPDAPAASVRSSESLQPPGDVIAAGDVGATSAADGDELPAEILARARSLAEAAIEAERGAPHRKLMRLVWPTQPPAPPRDGAEMTIIRGYMSYSLLRIEWRGGVASALGFDAQRSWFYNPDGESVGCRAFTVTPDDFLATWAAAQMVRGVTAERKEPLPEGGRRGGSFGSGSHESYLWVALRGDGTAPLAAMERGRRSGPDDVREWGQIRDRSLHELVRALDDREHAAATPLAALKSFTERTLDEYAERLDLDWSSPDRLLLELVLRAAGEVGDARTMTSIERISTHVATLDPEDYAVRSATANLRNAATRIRLRNAWSAAAAADVIHHTEQGKHQDADLVKWTRALFLDRDPEAYLAFLIADLAPPVGPDAAQPRTEETVAELEAHFPGARRVLDASLASTSADTRAAAALALARLGEHGRALPVLEALAADTTLRDPTWDLSPDGPRLRALRYLLEQGAWTTERVRAQLFAPELAAPSEDGHVVRTLVEHLAATGSPLTGVEQREAFRPVLDGPLDGGFLVACRALAQLDDRPSFPRMRERLGAMAAIAAGPEGEAIGRWHRERTIPELRAALTDE